MKTIMLSLTGIIFSISFAQNIQNKDIPQVVKEKFASSFTGATHVKWTKEKSDFEASFRNGKKEMSVNFNEKGNIIETEIEIKVADLPAVIKNSVSKDYPGYKITEAAKIESKGIVTWEAEVTRGKDKMDVIYDEQGVQKSKEKK
jgi:hypothetical protein